MASQGRKGSAIYDVVLEQSQAAYLGPLSRGSEIRGERSIPRTENEKNKFQELVLCSGDGRDGMYDERYD